MESICDAPFPASLAETKSNIFSLCHDLNPDGLHKWIAADREAECRSYLLTAAYSFTISSFDIRSDRTTFPLFRPLIAS